ncbi:hypothetical protein Tcan_12759 [Toxocara canis]|uniref:Uncharacterized protein n=1 Tax=Toxocara canis TaxID=6265 RepID=A0A0B2VJV0_TOXCA|nr:hypothetical protein Tcan_12759 [Toxocara canis]
MIEIFALSSYKGNAKKHNTYGNPYLKGRCADSEIDSLIRASEALKTRDFTERNVGSELVSCRQFVPLPYVYASA